MSEANPSVLVIDDDPEFRDSVARLLRTIRLETRQFSSISDFLKADPPAGPTCLVLDVRMPGRSGLELQRDLAAANRQVPIIFITAHADVPMTVQAMKGGAIEFLTKPFRDQDLLDAVGAGLARDHAACRGRSPKQTNCQRHRYRRIHGEGTSHAPDAEDEGALAARAQPDGGRPQYEITAAAELVSRPKGIRLRRSRAR